LFSNPGLHPIPIYASEAKRLEWKNLIEQQRQNGISIEKWCLQNQINRHIFHYWKGKRFPNQLQKSSFTELCMKHTEAIYL
jgi:hypothetical protein